MKRKNRKNRKVIVWSVKVMGIVFLSLFLISLFLMMFSFKSKPYIELFCTYLSAFSTVFLGIIAYGQTERLYENEEYSKNLNTKRPYFIIDKVVSDDKEFKYMPEESCYVIRTSKKYFFLYIKNLGDGPAINVKMDPEPNQFGEIEESEKKHWNTQQGDFEKICICPDKYEDEYKISYANMIDCKYWQTLKIEKIPLDENLNDFDYEYRIYPISEQFEK